MPPNMTTSTHDYGTETFKILVSWDDQGADYYILSFNISTVNTSMTTHILIGEYNNTLEVTLLAVKCAWISEAATVNISEGRCVYSNLKNYGTVIFLSQLAVLLPLHLSMVVLMSGLVPG